MQEPPSEGELQQTLRNYLETWAKESLPALDKLSEETSAETLEEITKALEKVADNEFDAITQDATAEFIDAIEATFQEWAKTARAELDPDSSYSQSLYKVVLDFFETEEWAFAKDDHEPILYMNFQSENGQWLCLAKANDDDDQFVFYSICPVTIPEDKRQAAAEFITRANYGLLIGNFELDFDDGEIRYKTSIDVEGDTLSQNLIKQLVYTNVTTIDEYLPGIIAVVEGKLSPQEAIAKIEN